MGAAIVWAAMQIAGAIGASRSSDDAALRLFTLFAGAIATSDRDPRQLLVWQPLAAMARQLHPQAFVELDRAAGGVFPFGKAQFEAAHAKWTTEWLAWERNHDAEYRMKAATIEHELAASGGAPVLRARLDAVEREKLDSYQRRYEEYITVAKALQKLAD